MNSPKARNEKAERTNIEAAAVIDAERKAREAKTARLKAARIAAEAAKK